MDQNQDQNQNNRGIIGRGNHAISATRRLGRRFGKRSVGKMVAKRTAIFLISNPIGWIILLIILLIFLFLIIIIIFFGNPDAPITSEESCDTGICYYLEGDYRIDNGGYICYQITLILDPGKSVSEIYDHYPISQFDSNQTTATGVKTIVTDPDNSANKEVNWKLSANPSSSTNLDDPLFGCPDIVGSPPSATISGAQTFYFKLKLKPSETDVVVENSIGVR